MSWMLAFAMQTAAAAPPLASDFDLQSLDAGKDSHWRAIGRAERCGDGGPNEIVVCGRRGAAQRDRLRPLPPASGKPLVAEVGIFSNVRANLHAHDAGMPDGKISHRIMLTFKCRSDRNSRWRRPWRTSAG